jgi:hypothetical protein
MLFTVIRQNLKIFYLAHVLSPIASLQKLAVIAELGNQTNPPPTLTGSWHFILESTVEELKRKASLKKHSEGASREKAQL